MVDVLILTLCGALCGLDELQDIVTYGEENLDFLRGSFGVCSIPSVSTMTRIMDMVDGEKLAACIVNIMREQIGAKGDTVAFDGKTIRATAKGGREKLHVITAYVTESGVVLGQKTVGGKTNEIPTMREMLEWVDVKGKTVTADAMHCQKETPKAVIKAGGDYIWGLKGNQGTFHDGVKLYLDDCIERKDKGPDIAKTQEKNGGRIEQRACYKCPDTDWFADKQEWDGLRCIFAVERIFRDAKTTMKERSHYISSKDTSAKEPLRLTREHWKVGSMHWQLDVVFSEGQCRILSVNGQKTMNSFRKLSLAFHKNYLAGLPQKTKPSIRKHMFKALLSNQLLKKVLSLSVRNA